MMTPTCPATRRARIRAALLAALLAAALAAAGGPPAARAQSEGSRIEAAVAAAPDLPPEAAADPGRRRGPVTSLPLPRYVSMRADGANARRGPSLDQRIDWEFLKRGLPLRITAEFGQWRRVEDAEGMGGWMHQALLSGVRTALVQAPAPVTLRSGPDPAADTRALAEPGVIARLERCAGDWCEVAVDGFAGWLPRADLWGVDPGEEIE